MVNINKIISLAKSKGISQTFLCTEIDKGSWYLRDLKNGKGKLSDKELIIIADALGTTPEYLCDETDENLTEQQKESLANKVRKELLDKLGSEIVTTYDELSPENKNVVLDIAKSLLRQQKQK